MGILASIACSDDDAHIVHKEDCDALPSEAEAVLRSNDAKLPQQVERDESGSVQTEAGKSICPYESDRSGERNSSKTSTVENGLSRQTSNGDTAHSRARSKTSNGENGFIRGVSVNSNGTELTRTISKTSDAGPDAELAKFAGYVFRNFASPSLAFVSLFGKGNPFNVKLEDFAKRARETGFRGDCQVVLQSLLDSAGPDKTFNRDLFKSLLLQSVESKRKTSKEGSNGNGSQVPRRPNGTGPLRERRPSTCSVTGVPIRERRPSTCSKLSRSSSRSSSIR